MPTINWDENTPAGTESLGLGDDRIRSLKTALRTGLDGEHVWPSAGGDAGVHRLGAARPYYGTQSLVSSTGTDGRLMATSDTSRLFGVGSTATTFYGGATVISAGSFPGTIPQRHIWVTEFGDGALGASNTTSIAIPNSGYSGIPFVVVSASTTAAASVSQALGVVSLEVVSKTQGSFTVNGVGEAGVAVAFTRFDWMSFGSRVL